MKLLLTGDLHLGREYQNKSPEVTRRLKEARFEALKSAVEIANRNNCEVFVIAGDLYDRVANIPLELQKKVCQVLAEFDGKAVLVLPGNHDYYDPERAQLWKTFEECAGSHVRLLKENAPYSVGSAVFYPCPCHDKHSKENALGWLKEGPGLSPDAIHIGIAHGAVAGYSPDANQIYYHMTAEELLALGMDAWLVGHTHVGFSIGERIFNAGTPQQTDIGDNSGSEVALIEIDDKKRVTVEKAKTGAVDFVRREVSLSHGQRLEEVLQFPDLDRERTYLRVILGGVAAPEDYEGRYPIYEKCGEGFLGFEIKEDRLQRAITPELIDAVTLDGTVLNRLLHAYEDDMELLNLAYFLVKECTDDKHGGKERKR